MNLIKSGSLPTKRGAAAWFTGDVWVDEITVLSESSRVHVLRVSFEPDARTAWHSHPLGQTLHILSGLGRVQKAGESAVDVHPGDTVWFAPGERHWHGAAPGHAMVHLAAHQATPDDNEVTWFELVTDAQYYGR